MPDNPSAIIPTGFVDWFRQAAPYIHAHRGKTFVLLFGGAAVADDQFAHIVHDVALLNSLGVRLVLVHGARPQIEQRLEQRGVKMRYVKDVRVTDDAAMDCVKEAVGAVRVEIEALLSMGVANSPMEGACLRVASGNYVTAKPVGVRDGVDFLHTGEVRRVDADAIRNHLDSASIVILPPLGYSPTGEIFNVSADEIAASTAAAIGADKLICLTETDGLLAAGKLLRECSPDQAENLLGETGLHQDDERQIKAAAQACRRGVSRCHLVSRHRDGAILQELYTRNGAGTMISESDWEILRPANIDDVGGILELIEPLEQSGVLVRRPREQLELEIDRFTLIEQDGAIIACAALYPYADSAVAELACVAVHADYRGAGRGERLLQRIRAEAREMGLKQLFVLTTQAAQWFEERGFVAAAIDQLPLQKQAMYNWQRNSRVYIMTL